jgi:hypothetical protein
VTCSRSRSISLYSCGIDLLCRQIAELSEWLLLSNQRRRKFIRHILTLNILSLDKEQ